MHRRTFLVATAGCGLSGCLSRGSDDTSDSTGSPTKGGSTETPVRRTADDLAATFRVVDSHAPTADSASATFDEDRVTVEGTVDPSGCDRPALSSVSYDAAEGVVHLTVGGKSRFGPTATVECGNASFDYRSVLTADRGRPTAVEVVHDYRSSGERTFTLRRE